MTSVNQVKAFIRALERQIKGPGFYPLEAEGEVIASAPGGCLDYTMTSWTNEAQPRATRVAFRFVVSPGTVPLR